MPTGFVNIDKFRREIAEYKREVRAAVELGVKNGSDKAIAEFRNNPPFKSRSGRLVNRTLHRISGKNTIKVRFFNSVKYAPFIQFGTTAHIIRPKTKGRWMKFHWAKVGQTVFAKLVYHPGNKAYKFLSTVRDNAARYSIAEIESRLPKG